MNLPLRRTSLALALLAGALVPLAACGGSDDSAAPTGTAGSGTAGSGTAGSGTAGTAGTGTAGSGTAGTGTAGSGTAGTSTAGSAGSGTAGTSTAGSAGSGTAGTMAGKVVKAADGGTITADGLLVEIPPGALMADTEITVVVSDGASLPSASSLVAKVYDLGPNGTTFSKPVKLTIDYDAAKLGTKQAVVSYLEGAKWIGLTDSAASAGKVTATTMHFTPFGVLSSDAAACVAMAKADCQSCCKSTFAKGSGEPIAKAFEYCACAAGSPCEADCASNACMGQPVSSACQTCLSAVGSMNPAPACIVQVQQACVASPDCMAYLTCNASCK